MTEPAQTQIQSRSELLLVLEMHMHAGYLLTAGSMFESINTPLCEGC